MVRILLHFWFADIPFKRMAPHTSWEPKVGKHVNTEIVVARISFRGVRQSFWNHNYCPLSLTTRIVCAGITVKMLLKYTQLMRNKRASTRHVATHVHKVDRIGHRFLSD